MITMRSTRLPISHPGGDAPSGPLFVSRFILTAMALVTAMVSIAAAPSTVTVPIGVALLAGLVVTGIVAAGDRMAAMSPMPVRGPVRRC